MNGGSSSGRRTLVLTPIRYRGTLLGPQALSQIRKIVRECEGGSRTHVVRRICRFFGWCCANGAPAVQSAMGVLARVEREGLIRLPAARRRSVAPRASNATRCEFAAMPSFAAPPAGANGVFVRPLLLEERDSYRTLLARHHYLGWRRPPGNALGHVAYCGGEVVALVGWATATRHNGPRDRWIGWQAPARARHLRFVATNVRFLMLPLTGAAGTAPHLASQVLGASLRRLSADWQALHGHPLLLAETFVDGSRFKGTCYRASNWIRVGETSGWSRRGKVYSFHGQPKEVFVFPLHRRARERLSAADPPAHAGGMGVESMMMDVTRLPLEGDAGLLDLIGDVADPRRRRGIRHSAKGVLAMSVTAVLAGMKSLAAIAQWIEDLPGEMRERLGGNRYRKPSMSTIRRLLFAIDVAELDRRLGEWTMRHRNLDLQGQGLAIDGKTLRGSRDGGAAAVHLVSVVLHRDGEVVAQTRVSDKSNEIKSVEPALRGLAIAGATVTGDAMYTQTAIAKHLVEEKQADYLFTVKDNQPGLRVDIENMGLESFSPAVRHDLARTRAARDAQDLG